MSGTNDKPVNRSPANSKESPPLKPVQSREPESEGDNPNLHDEALITTEGERAMTEFKHTPGPWEYVPSTENHGAYVVSDWGSDVADCYTMSNPGSAAVCNGGNSKPIPFQGDQSDANARLIAAAPDGADLAQEIDALQSAIDASRAVTPHHWAQLERIAGKARALLAKIKGE